jgi:predicted ATP-grasp superfamily ATP-dependent carboligase
MVRHPRKLAIVGASARAAVFSAVNAGYETVAADLFADADLRQACRATRVEAYPEGLAAWLAATECDGWLYTGALENYPALVDRMAAMRPLLGTCGDALRRVRDPAQLERAVQEAGLWFPETRPAADGLPLDGSWLAKTYRGSSGSGVWRLDGPAALERARRHGAQFQRLVAGEPAAAIFVVGAERSQLLGVTRQLVGGEGGSPSEFQYRGSTGRLHCSAGVASQLVRLGDALSSMQLRGLAGVDLVIEGERAWVVEINPRYTASVEVVERATGGPAIAAHVAACTGATLPASGGPPASEHRFGKAILLADRDVTITDSFFRWALPQASIDPARRRLADLPAAGERIRAGRPVLTVLVESSGDCRPALAARLAEVRERLGDGPP